MIKKCTMQCITQRKVHRSLILQSSHLLSVHEDLFISFVYLIHSAKEKAAQEKAAKEEAEEEAEANKKRHLNVVFIGHVGMATC